MSSLLLAIVMLVLSKVITANDKALVATSNKSGGDINQQEVFAKDGVTCPGFNAANLRHYLKVFVDFGLVANMRI